MAHHISEFSRISPDVILGADVKIHGFVNLYGCEIGDGTKVGAFVEVQRGVVIGKNCKVSSHSFICEGVKIEEGVFIGHGVMFTNDRYPRATNQDGTLQNQDDWQLQETLVRRGVSIGSNATILCGIEIGESAIVGAGSVVTRNVPPYAIAVGNPAKVMRYVKDQERELP